MEEPATTTSVKHVLKATKFNYLSLLFAAMAVAVGSPSGVQMITCDQHKSRSLLIRRSQYDPLPKHLAYLPS